MIPLRYASDVAFTPAVKAIQAAKGSRAAYARMEAGGSWQTEITPLLRDFIAAQTSVFLATVNSEGQPYIQHRGGPAGFLCVLDEHTLGFVDYSGNRQFITTGNLGENRKAHLFLIDYAEQRRVKIWGEVFITQDIDLMAQLMPPQYRAKGEQVMIFRITAWDANCPQHIPQRFEAAEVARLLQEKDARIEELTAEIRRLKGGLESSKPLYSGA